MNLFLSWLGRDIQILKKNWLMVWTLEILKSFHFNGLLISKVYIVWVKKVQRSNLSWNWRRTQNLERNRLVVSKLPWEIWQILIWALQKSKKNLVLIGSLWPKNVLFELQRYRRVIFHDTEKLCKFWRKTD